MRIFNTQLNNFKRQLVTELDNTQAIGGCFLSSLTRDAFVRHFNDFAKSDCLSKIAYKASCAAMVTVSSRMQLGASTLVQLTSGLVLGLVALEAPTHIFRAVISGSMRGVRKVIKGGERFVAPSYVEDVAHGLCSALAPETVPVDERATRELIRELYYAESRSGQLVLA